MKKSLPLEEALSHHMYYGTYSALKSLIESCYYSQIRYGSAGHPSEMGACKEMYTVKMASSRRSGHTTAIARAIPEYFNRALILSHNRCMSDGLKKAFTSIYRELQAVPFDTNLTPIRIEEQSRLVTEDSEYIFGSTYNLRDFQGYNIRFEAVVVDASSILTDKEEEDIYRYLLPCMLTYPERFFIFVE